MFGVRRTLRRIVRKLSRETPVSAPPPATPPYVETEEEEPNIEVLESELKDWMSSETALLFLDVREPRELASGHAAGARLIPMNHVPHNLDALPKDIRIVVYCAAGARSYGVTTYLREHGYPDTWSLAEGFAGFASAGGEVITPVLRAKFPLTALVRTTEGVLGTVQQISQEEDGPRYAIGMVQPDVGFTIIDNLCEADLSRPGLNP